MDLSKVERQAPAEERNSEPSNHMRILLQDMLCFFLLLSVALLIVAAILYVADDVTRLQHRPRDPINASRAVSVEEAHKRMHRILQPDAWFRLFNCQKQHDERMLQQHERSQRREQGNEQEQLLGEGQGDGLGLNQPAKQKELDEQQPFGPYFAPTYGPNNHPEHNRVQAVGDHVVQNSVGNQLDSKPETSFEFF